jgi:hypothetical protein
VITGQSSCVKGGVVQKAGVVTLVSEADGLRRSQDIDAGLCPLKLSELRMMEVCYVVRPEICHE